MAYVASLPSQKRLLSVLWLLLACLGAATAEEGWEQRLGTALAKAPRPALDRLLPLAEAAPAEERLACLTALLERGAGIEERIARLAPLLGRRGEEVSRHPYAACSLAEALAQEGQVGRAEAGRLLKEARGLLAKAVPDEGYRSLRALRSGAPPAGRMPRTRTPVRCPGHPDRPLSGPVRRVWGLPPFGVRSPGASGLGLHAAGSGRPAFQHANAERSYRFSLKAAASAPFRPRSQAA